MKKIAYILVVLLIAAAISYSVAQVFRPLLEIVTQITAGDTIALMDVVWQFMLLGFVIGGVIFTIPRHALNEDYLKLSGIFCVLGSALMVSVFGFGVALKAHGKESSVILTLCQLGLLLFYAGIAITIIELMKECWRYAVKFWKH